MPRPEPVYTRNVSIEHDAWDTSLVVGVWTRDDGGKTRPERIEALRIPVEEIPAFLTQLTNHAMQALSDAATRLAIGHCETCANTGLIRTTRHGNPWSESCPDCAERRSQPGFTDVPRIGYRDPANAKDD